MNEEEPGGRRTADAGPGQTGAGAQQPSEEELRAALEQELKRLTVNDVLLQTVVSLLNLGGRRAGLAPGTEDERDLEQVQIAIEGARALVPLIEHSDGASAADLSAIRDALSQLQMAYAKLSSGEGEPPGGDGEPAPGGSPGEEGQADAAEKQGDETEQPGPAQSSGRLWVPGQ
ncbi:MAG: hypothetical protein QOD76_821 [Solirubrobacteraceae bacterium]|nr:hypothetical protein [Solirubrobacteraceae bacterium]